MTTSENKGDMGVFCTIFFISLVTMEFSLRTQIINNVYSL